MSEESGRLRGTCQEFDAVNRELNAFVVVRHLPASRQDQTPLPQEADRGSGCSCGDDRVATAGIKDNIRVEGFPLGAGLAAPVLTSSQSVSGRWVKWLVRQGFVIKGKTNMYELGYGAPGCGLPPAVNPWNHSLIPGGSSSGSAGAVAAALCDVALGTDAAGSVRIPAEFCGVLSYKPSGKHAWHKDGVWPGPSTLDAIGVMARDLDMLAQAVPSLRGRGEMDRNTGAHVPSDAGREDLCIGILDLEGEEVDDDHAFLLGEVRTWAQNRGYSTVNVRLPGLGRQVRDAIWKIFAYEYSRALQSHLTEEARTVLSAPSRQLLTDGPKTSPDDYSGALIARRRFKQQYAEELSGCHAVITPVTPVRPYSLVWSRAFAQCEEGDPSGSPIDLSNVEALLTRKTRYTAPINLVEYPTLTLPMRLHRDGLPVGIQMASVPENEFEMWSIALRMWQELGPQRVRQHGRGKLYGSFADTWEGR
jgi:Asp-tRNA(Asn)/Glu-tRNA(Gln) amidotransferase A subunit family amidase